MKRNFVAFRPREFVQRDRLSLKRCDCCCSYLHALHTCFEEKLQPLPAYCRPEDLVERLRVIYASYDNIWLNEGIQCSVDSGNCVRNWYNAWVSTPVQPQHG